MDTNDKLIFVGVISSAHGIKGEVVVKSFTDPIDNIGKLSLITETGEKVALRFIRILSNDRVLCKLKDTNTRTEAEKLKGYKFFTLRTKLPELSEDEFYITDLKDLTIVDTALNKLGVVNDILNFGASDIIEIKFDNGTIELFSFTKELFPVITKNHLIFNNKSE